jgi:hypothetical protein
VFICCVWRALCPERIDHFHITNPVFNGPKTHAWCSLSVCAARALSAGVEASRRFTGLGGVLTRKRVSPTSLESRFASARRH